MLLNLERSLWFYVMLTNRKVNESDHFQRKMVETVTSAIEIRICLMNRHGSTSTAQHQDMSFNRFQPNFQY